ncbi:MAG TPA: Asp-tRNA(Asn)/Glu-tRNA(Gln) amidotransferase subunit GatA [Clostridiales bacterium]|nr:Asp-tRNA(Asn)/Glu-tRNA(Gln) amidotransferase subunit GatA [Clostridiales bacterium]
MELYKLTIHEARELLRKREISSRELTKSVLERIRATEGEIRSFISIDFNNALKQAERFDKMQKKSELHELPDLAGIPYGLKDNICTRNMRTTCASRIMEYFSPVYEGTVVKKLRDSHAVLIGKLNMDEFAIGSSGETSIFPHTRNPWSADRVPGGSSGGSAASVAADQLLFSLGSDTGGSIRQPSSFCGIVGMKPTFGAVSCFGLVPFATSLDQIGPLCKDVTDCAIVMNAITGFDARDKASAKIKHPDYTTFLIDDVSCMRIGFSQKWMAGNLNEDVRNAIEKAKAMFEDMGAVIEEVSLPHIEYAVPVYFLISSAEASYNLTGVDGIRMGYEKGAIPELDELAEYVGMHELGSAVKKRILLGNIALCSEHYETYYMKALKVRTLIKQDFAQAFEKLDLILSPTNPDTAFRFGEMQDNIVKMYEYDAFTVPVNLAGLPAMSIPCGFDSKGLPIGMQLIGKHFGEEALFRAAYTFEQNTDHHLKSPLLRHPQ